MASEHPQHQKVLEQVGLSRSPTVSGGSDAASPTRQADASGSGPSWQSEAVRIHRAVVKAYPVKSPEDWRFLALSLAGEAGELANDVKKEWRGDVRTDRELTAWLQRVKKEWADIRIYLELIAWVFDFDGDTVTNDKLQELYERFDVPRP